MCGTCKVRTKDPSVDTWLSPVRVFLFVTGHATPLVCILAITLGRVETSHAFLTLENRKRLRTDRVLYELRLCVVTLTTYWVSHCIEAFGLCGLASCNVSNLSCQLLKNINAQGARTLLFLMRCLAGHDIIYCVQCTFLRSS